MEKTEGKFIELVEEMRRAQKGFFKHRDMEVLKKSRELERGVDNFIFDLKNPKLL